MNQKELIHIKKVLNKNQCNSLIKEYEDRKHTSETESCINALTENVMESTFNKIELLPNTDNFNIVHKAIGTIIKDWVKNLNQKASTLILKNRVSFTHQYRLMCYEPGGWIHPHVDFDDYCYASCTINLNTDYKGGDFYFFNKKHKVKLAPGEAMIFPASPFWIHEVTEVTKGKRYSVNCFLLSIPFEVQNSVNQQIYESRKEHLNNPYYHNIKYEK